VSYDLYVWKSGTTDDPGQLADQLAEIQADGYEFDPAEDHAMVSAFTSLRHLQLPL
jgi:DNA-binding IclR family transcriptional regulator